MFSHDCCEKNFWKTENQVKKNEKMSKTKKKRREREKKIKKNSSSGFHILSVIY